MCTPEYMCSRVQGQAHTCTCIVKILNTTYQFFPVSNDGGYSCIRIIILPGEDEMEVKQFATNVSLLYLYMHAYTYTHTHTHTHTLHVYNVHVHVHTHVHVHVYTYSYRLTCTLHINKSGVETGSEAIITVTHASSLRPHPPLVAAPASSHRC